ncbi:hypothetical protein WJX72_008520 [[Myrmecia] bisecta]|uniref:Uncharacterized protein n=1 Tax=[Myrmecia] bisecta TaxID=41462 RepID=A0AAW1Q824_9CHLO
MPAGKGNAALQPAQEFVRCQGSSLLKKLPPEARGTLRHYEVACLLQDFQPAPPLAGPDLGGRSFWYFVVTDWSMFIVSMLPEAARQSAFEVPLLAIRTLGKVGIEEDVTSNNAVNAACTRIEIGLTRTKQLAAAAPDSPSKGDDKKELRPVPTLRSFSLADAHMSVKPMMKRQNSTVHLGFGSVLTMVLKTMDLHAAQPATDPDHQALSVLTIEQHSTLYFHLWRAWIGAHSRSALASAHIPNSPLSWQPPRKQQGIVRNLWHLPMPSLMGLMRRLSGGGDLTGPAAAVALAHPPHEPKVPALQIPNADPQTARWWRRASLEGSHSMGQAELGALLDSPRSRSRTDKAPWEGELLGRSLGLIDTSDTDTLKAMMLELSNASPEQLADIRQMLFTSSEECVVTLVQLLLELQNPLQKLVKDDEPKGVHDLMWWCASAADLDTVDSVACILFDLMGFAERAFFSGVTPVRNVVLTALRAAPHHVFRSTLTTMFRRLVLLMQGTTVATSAATKAFSTITAFRLAYVLNEILEEVTGAPYMLFESFHEELRYIVSHPHLIKPAGTSRSDSLLIRRQTRLLYKAVLQKISQSLGTRQHAQFEKEHALNSHRYSPREFRMPPTPKTPKR